jgi:hypothetical protein
MKKIKDRNLLISEFQKNLKIAEIGVFKGEFSKFIFDKIDPKELHLIDIFEGQMCSGDKDGNNIVWTDLNVEYQNLKNYFHKYDNVYLHKGFSSDVLSKFEDNYFDIIYIDGDHSYEGVKKDLKISHKKVKKDGLICGHDYTDAMFRSVVMAVDEFCEEMNLKIEYLTEDVCPSFVIIKK